jgi:tRNA threonylcarbamoyl adenosine modification protein YeaZ
MTGTSRVTLAIEAAISGGSLCLIEAGVDIATREGNSDISRAEDLLAEIDGMLTETGRRIADVGLVAVSAGPGSFTGIRIGIATAQGLTTGLGIELASESALRAMAKAHPGHRDLLVAVPAGRGTVCYQIFNSTVGGDVDTNSRPLTANQAVFLSSIPDHGDRTVLLHRDLFETIDSQPNVIDFGRNVAGAIGRICDTVPLPRTSPLFISKEQ